MNPDGTAPHVDEQLTALRARIDELDAHLQDLLRERLAVSRQVQDLRRMAGVFGLQPEREAAVISGYVAALGPCGCDVARAVLVLCRGRGDVEGTG